MSVHQEKMSGNKQNDIQCSPKDSPSVRTHGGYLLREGGVPNPNEIPLTQSNELAINEFATSMCIDMWLRVCKFHQKRGKAHRG